MQNWFQPLQAELGVRHRPRTQHDFGRCLLLLIIATARPSIADTLFDDTTVIDVDLVGPLTPLIDTKKDRHEMPFLLRVNGIEHDVKVRVRGKSRIRVCTFAPIRLNFNSDIPAESVFVGQDKLKLVTHCHKDKGAEAYVFKEYLAYRTFNVISDISFRVRLLRINYVDSEGRLDAALYVRHAFAIEGNDALAARMNVVSVELPGIVLNRLDQEQAALMYVFQYLIGNTDWSLVTAADEEVCCHNGTLFKRDKSLFYVPYDFDLAGLVAARYAKPDPSLNIRSVKTRRYRGFCLDRSMLKTALDRIVERKSKILGLLDEVEAMDDKQANRASKYLEAFFEEAEKRDKLLKKFEKSCLKDT